MVGEGSPGGRDKDRGGVGVTGESHGKVVLQRRSALTSGEKKTFGRPSGCPAKPQRGLVKYGVVGGGENWQRRGGRMHTS